jgi:N-acetylneuraminate synthase
MSQSVKVGSYMVGTNQPVYTIAEIGINHNGSLDNALKLIDASSLAGFNAVKFQKRTVDVVYTAEELSMPRESVFGNTNGDLKRGLEFGKSEYEQISARCKSNGIDWFASPWDELSVDFLEELGVIAYKIASASITDKGLLERVRRTGKPVFMSTGMANLEIIQKAVNCLDSSCLILMHTVSTYPASNNDLNLSAIRTLRSTFPNVPIGYSGHEVGLLPSIIAVAKYDAVCIERHVTLDRAMWGSDQAASIEPSGMIRLIRDIKSLTPMYGSGNKEILEKEIPIMKKLRRKNDLL